MIVILGADGMLGRAFSIFYGNRALCLTRNDCDFTDYSKLTELLNSIECSLIINCAAIIDFGYIEEFERKAFEVNALLPYQISKYCERRKCQFVHISTDHFYIDTLEKHCESSSIVLVNKYAEQKFVAEQLVLNANPTSLVVRASILGFKDLDGSTFIEWILRTVKNKKSINGFDDAITSSIETGLLCFYVDKAIAQNLSGIYNIGTQKPYSKYELISAIINTLGLKDIVLNKRSVKTLAVVRANNCGLDSRKYAQKTGLILPTMNQVVSNLKVREFYNEI
jgi:dTDP-4-dehydrorhamnose reductase